MKKIIVIGAGPSGLGAAYALSKKGFDVSVLDNRDSIGGLCGHFKVKDFIFDQFIHVSFAKDPDILDLYRKACESISFTPIMYNRYKDNWIPHPAQYHLYSLSWIQKIRVLLSYFCKNRYKNNNYREWLYKNYGRVFSDMFPMQYTKLYWQTDPSDMETKWLNGRMYDLSIWKLLKGFFIDSKEITYYASSFSYPLKGGFSSFFEYIAEDLDIKFNSSVVCIDMKNKFVLTNRGERYIFDYIINTSPLNELCNIVVNVDDKIKEESKKLNFTSGYLVSIGLNKDPSFNNALYFYNYNTDILTARVYFPHKKTVNNCPKGTFSLQIEIYTRNGQLLDTRSQEFRYTINEILSYCNLSKDNVLFEDIRFEKYANIIFDKNIYNVRSLLLEYYSSLGISSIGRFGTWDYLWSFQALRQGLDLEL